MIRPDLAALALLVLPLALPAQDREPALRFAKIFNDHAVLQRGKPLKIWGRAQPDSRVRLTLGAASSGANADATVEAQVDPHGLWVAWLGPLEASATPRSLIATSNDERTTLSDILVGDVWLCSGQSNMRWGVGSDTEWSMEKKCSDFPAVRYCAMGDWSSEPLEELPKRLTWVPLTRDHDLAGVSAVSYHFAARLHRYLGVPIGIVHNAIGGSQSESWTSLPTLTTIPALAGFLSHHDARVRAWPAEKARRQEQYEADVAAAKAGDRDAPRRPRLDGPLEDRNQPAGCYNGLIAPISRLTMRGALFLQGENNSIGKWNIYAHSFPAMIADWRRAFGDDELPFGIISLQGFGPHGLELEPEMVNTPPGLFWYAAIRDVHFRTYRSTPHTGLIAAHDIGDTANIHPHLKRGIGQRAARWALAEVYGEPVIHRAPEYLSCAVDGKKMVLTFEVDPATRAVGQRKDGEVVWWLDYPITRQGRDYRGFVVAGEDKRFWPARVRRAKEPGQLEVWNDNVPEPVAVRYAWSGYPEANAIGHDFLPVPPFRTDDWPLIEDTPFDQEGRKAWNDRMVALRRAAQRQSDERALAEARELIARLGRELRHEQPEDERQDLQRQVEDARDALARLATLLAEH